MTHTPERPGRHHCAECGRWFLFKFRASSHRKMHKARWHKVMG